MQRFWIVSFIGWLLSLGTAWGRTLAPAFESWSNTSSLALPAQGWLVFPGELLNPDQMTPFALQRGIKVDDYVGLWSQMKPIENYSKGAVTYRARLHIPNIAGHTIFLSSRDFLRAVRIYINGKELIQLGKVALEREDYVASKSYIFQSFRVDSDDVEIILQVSDFSGGVGGIWAPVYLYGERSGILRMQIDLVVFSGVLVTLMFMSVYFIFLFFIYRHRLSLLLVGLFLMTTGIFLFLTGDTREIVGLYEFLGYELHTRLESAAGLISSMIFLSFLAHLFPKEYAKRVNQLYYFASSVFLVLLGLAPIDVAERTIMFLILPYAFLLCYITISSLQAVYYRRVGARLWVFGALVFMTCVMVDIGKYQALLNFPNVNHLGLLIFTMVQALVVIQQLSQDDRQKRHAYQQLAKVFYPHQLTKMMNGQILEDTMPQGMTKACVICFDIVSSSSLEHDDARKLFTRIFSECHDALMERYDQDTMIANGYRIKEVGDGFYCSVGFPFDVPQGKSPYDLALELSFRFVRIFDEIIENDYKNQPLQCSIGIAYDKVEAYFSDAGTRTYDLFGRAVILASRYEDLRRSFFAKELRLNIITVQEKVFENLSLSNQDKLKEFDLKQRSFKVRDDPSAHRFFYWSGKRGDLAVEPLPTIPAQAS